VRECIYRGIDHHHGEISFSAQYCSRHLRPGPWTRTDAPYVIELRHAKDGSMQATYFNPKPINVSKTEAAEQGGLVQVMIELQDVNYPGSTYVLSYDRTRDILEGIYFHPATKQSYEVGFVRQVAQ
jgi:hypothetical protein